MTKKSSTKKGNEFEKKVYLIIKDLLENEQLFLPGKRSKIFWKKGYYSDDRKDNIIFDIAIETYIINVEEYSFLTIIECKNYGHKVPIDDIEEFDSKLSQVGEHNTKGIIITSSSFQSGALKVGSAKKIGLAVINGSEEVNWISYRKDRRKTNYTKPVIEKYLSNNLKEANFFAFHENKSIENIPELLLKANIIDRFLIKPSYIDIPYKTEEEIQAIIDRLSKYQLYDNNCLNSNKICEFLADRYNVKFIFNESLEYYNGNSVLGKFNFNPLEIYISKELENDQHRFRFTLGHEIGHLILHKNILEKYIENNIDTENSFTFKNDFSLEINERLEIQANIFASRLLLPKEPMLNIVKNYFIKIRNYKGYLYLDSQPDNIRTVVSLLNEIGSYFNVSNEVAKYRLKNLGIIKDKSDTSIRNIYYSKQ